MGYVHLSGHSRSQGCVFLHKENCQLFDFRLLSVIIWICLKNHLLSFIPLLHDVTARTYGVLSIIFIIGMFRNDSYDSHGIRPDGIGPGHMELYCSIVYGHSFFQHGKVIY